ncbi:PAS domain-containing sensor histidine kinase, partial [Gammaproteobacteria bacterium]|nr:PAS domain-containing sensor histidine kinase [Gammaproteobacteria bacterium]
MHTERFNTSLLDHLTSAVVVLDSSFCLFHLNPAAEALFKTSERRSRNSYIGDLLYEPEVTLKALRKVQKNKNTFIARKVQLALANGTKLLADYSISPINDQEQDFLLVEIQELDRSYHISRGETLISNHETTLELVRNLGHEIKNPLGGIRGAAQLLALE